MFGCVGEVKVTEVKLRDAGVVQSESFVAGVKLHDCLSVTYISIVTWLMMCLLKIVSNGKDVHLDNRTHIQPTSNKPCIHSIVFL